MRPNIKFAYFHGNTGTGKSSSINVLSQKNDVKAKEGNKYESMTGADGDVPLKVETVIDGETVILADSVGFGDTKNTLSDEDIIKTTQLSMLDSGV